MYIVLGFKNMKLCLNKPQKTTNIWILITNIIKEINLNNIAQMQPHLIL